MVPVKSSNVKAIGYDPDTGEMGVQYKSGDTVYTHPNITAARHQALMDSPSKGKHLAQRFGTESRRG
jgi:hypothetical protein